MISSLSSYISGIAVFLIFSSFVSLIAPQWKYREYVDLVMAFGLILIIINPLQSVTRFLNDFSQIGERLTMEGAGLTPPNLQEIEEAQKGLILGQYANELNVQLKRISEMCGGFTFVRGQFQLDDGDADFGAITAIYLTVAERAEGSASTRPPLIRVERVEVTPFNRAPAEENSDVETSRIAALKKAVSDFYRLSSEHIYVQVAD
jgi:hypothetical protein